MGCQKPIRDGVLGGVVCPALTQLSIFYTTKTLCNYEGISLHHTAPNAIHGSFHVLFHLVPVSPALGKLIHLFYTPDPVESVGIGDDRRQFLGVGWVDQVDLRKLAEGFEVDEELVVLETLDELEVMVHVAMGGSGRVT